MESSKLGVKKIRCIMSVLYSVGEGNDDPSVMQKLLEVNEQDGKPGYRLAPPEPLVLCNCEYDPPIFEKPALQGFAASAMSIFTQAVENNLIQGWQYRAGLKVADDGREYVAIKQIDRPILSYQKGKNIDEKVDNLKGNKKKRYNSVQEWKAKIIEEEGYLKGRSRSRSAEKSVKSEVKEVTPLD